VTLRTSRLGVFLGFLLAALPAFSLAADVPVPDTPAGRALSAWLDAFNSGEPARLEAFIREHPSWMKPDYLAKWRADVGGYDLLELSASDATNVFFHLKQKSSAVEEVGRLQVDAKAPASIKVLGLWRMSAGAKFAPITLDEPARARVVKDVAAAYEGAYLDPAIGRKMADTLREQQSRGEYRAITYGDWLAKKLTEDLRAISNDKHVGVRFDYFVLTGTAAQRAEAEAQQQAARNCDFEKPEHLPPNIGYLKFNGFDDPAVCAATASAAMTALAGSDALILDLRDNHGGNPDMALLLASYFFAEPVHLGDTIGRDEKAVKESWTLRSVPGRKFVGKPVYVLTSKSTFSAAEAVGYYLQCLKRATVIGETTGGGGHLTDTRTIDAQFSVRVPYARSISPVTKAGWEGAGVEPDLQVPAAEALEMALKLARAPR
jgi:Peptidase family S41/N-terminal domain of Peptidase_S41 in eukaryotic IRBP